MYRYKGKVSRQVVDDADCRTLFSKKITIHLPSTFTLLKSVVTTAILHFYIQFSNLYLLKKTYTIEKSIFFLTTESLKFNL